MASARVFNGRIWNSVPEAANDSGVTPIKPVLEGDGTIFVQIASYRGKFNGRKCPGNDLGICWSSSNLVRLTGTFLTFCQTMCVFFMLKMANVVERR